MPPCVCSYRRACVITNFRTAHQSGLYANGQPRRQGVNGVPLRLGLSQTRGVGFGIRATGRMQVDTPEFAVTDLTIIKSPPKTLKVQRIKDTVAIPGVATVFEELTESAFLSAEYDEGVVFGLRGGSEPTHCMDVMFAKLKARRFLASARCKMWWMTPSWGSNAADIPPETQFLLLELQAGGPYAIVLPLIDANRFRATIRPPRASDAKANPDAMWLRVESGCDKVKGLKWDHALYVGAGWDPYEVVEKGVVTAARLSGGAQSFKDKEVPESLDYFGWCTWDAFYSAVSAKGIKEGLNSLVAGSVPPKFLIIDDGWQLTDVDQPFRKPPSAKLLKDMPQAAETMDEYYNAERDVLSPAARNVPSSSSAGSVLEEISNVEHGQDSSTHQQEHRKPTMGTTEAKEKEEQRILIVRLGVAVLQRILGFLAGVFEVLVLTVYQYIVDPAPTGSLPVRAFTWLTNGPGRSAMLEFYAETGNFTRRLLSVEANGKFSSVDAGPDAFFTAKESLGKVVRSLREAFGLRHVYVWHGLPAYWSGVAPDGAGVEKYKAEIMYAKPTDSLLEIEPSMAWNPSVISGIGVIEDPRSLYEDMYRYLARSGIDGVKVDCQSGVGLIGTVMEGGPQIGLKFHAALEDAIAKHFPGNHAINCMCHSTENIYRFLNTAVARASDDFYPRDEPSFMPHLASCAYNGMFLSPLVLPDWDMFHSKHPVAQLHATARAVSGGPVYVSDSPKQHDFDLLRQLVLPDGSILRARLAGRPTQDCLFQDVMRDNESLLKVWNINRCNGIIAIFNVQGASWDRRRRRFHIHKRKIPPLKGVVRVAHVPLLGEAVQQEGALENGRTLESANGAHGGLFAVFDNRSKDVQLVSREQEIPVELAGGESLLVTIAPVSSYKGVQFAPLGLMNMLNGGGAVLSCMMSSRAAPNGAPAGAHLGPRWTVEVKGCGTFLMYCNPRPAQVMVGGASVDSVYDGQTGRLTVDLPDGGDLRHSVCVAF